MSARRGDLAVLFTVVLAVMAFHEAEHVVQVVQKDAIGAGCPNDCRGLLGFAFDLEWVHFLYNASIELTLLGLVVVFRLWSPFLLAGVALQAYHVVEHVVRLEQWFANGRHAPTPGILGKSFDLVHLHFALNTLVFCLVVAGFFHSGLHRALWRLRTPRRIGVAVALGVLAVAGTGAGWTQRPPTRTLAAGVHEGPIVLDRAQRLVGEDGAVVRGGIVITADDVVVRNVEVRDAERGIAIENATSVLLEDVTVHGALDGIYARRASIVVRGCEIRQWDRYAQAVDVSFAFDLPPSVVQGCKVRGGQEGLVAHMAHVAFRRNRVEGTLMRGITVTEMSMGEVRGNVVRNTTGVGIFCGDYSHCRIVDNDVHGTRPDPSSDDAFRAGFAIQAHFGAIATLGGNRVATSPGGIAAVADATIESD